MTILCYGLVQTSFFPRSITKEGLGMSPQCVHYSKVPFLMVIIVPSLQHCPVQCYITFNVLNSFSTRCVFPHLFPDPLQLRGRQLNSESQSLRFTDHLMEEGVRQRTCQGEELPPCPRLVYHTLECLWMGSIVQYALLSRVLTTCLIHVTMLK